MDAFGNRFIADAANGRIREVDAAGFITTVAGNGTSGYSGDGGAATNASLYYPTDVAVDASGNLFIADLENHRIRRVALTTDPAITIYNLTTNNAGNYTVIVSNPFGSITSSVAAVTLGLPPSISVQPAGQGVPAGTSATLSVTASSTEPLGYQWWNSAGAILDATNASYMLNPARDERFGQLLRRRYQRLWRDHQFDGRASGLFAREHYRPACQSSCSGPEHGDVHGHGVELSGSLLPMDIQ